MDLTAARERLLAERDRLRGVRAAADRLVEGAESAQSTELSTFDQHPADMGSEVFERERDSSVAQRVDAELEEVQAALRRIDDGTYGTCPDCGRPIGDARLEAMPAARYCVEDQARHERGGRG